MSENVTPFPNFPRAVRSAPDPLALYLRPGRNDHGEMLNLIASGDADCFGAVFDPSLGNRQNELKKQILEHKLDAILDPKTQQLALQGSYTPSLALLPWGNPSRPQVQSDFEGTSGNHLVAILGDFAVEKGFTQVIAPSHVLSSAGDPWLDIDSDAARQLRNYLDRRQGGAVQLIYSLALPYAMFSDKNQRRAVINRLKSVPASALWLKVDRFGSDSNPTAMRAYLEGAAEFHELGIPVVADHVGGVVGLALLAFGAVGGIAHGVTMGERFDSSAWRKPRAGKAFSPSPRVYFPAIDLLLERDEAAALLNASSRSRVLFGCTDTNCCRRGVKDMLENPRRLFLFQRIKEIGGLSQVPEQLRPQRFLDQHLRPATDKAVAAAGINWEDDAMAKKMQKKRKWLDALRVALGHHAERTPPQSYGALPKTRAAREARR
jgi:hypothetical protein